jgi:hypothetical protein
MPSRTTAASPAAYAAATQPAPLAGAAPTLYTARGITLVEPALKLGGVRHDLFHRDVNGLTASGAVVRRGRLILLHRERYMAWLLGRGTEPVKTLPSPAPRSGRRGA